MANGRHFENREWVQWTRKQKLTSIQLKWYKKQQILNIKKLTSSVLMPKHLQNENITLFTSKFIYRFIHLRYSVNYVYLVIREIYFT